ncbi:DUF2798 domain-containing protein [Magnetospirillum sp. 15-1]|uniref:DUF2798 domain-containing protein n=1 Tax=Magnetospirillum sp. 15-1 TaxID=1979370 RepID=UPI000BBBA45A|nr:DUF2798 domain-containing protein [Magnetospirillum sp. 15-1]
MRIKKLPKRFAGLVMPLILSLLMTCVVSAIAVLQSRGVDSQFLAVWPSTWAMSWVVAFPVLLGILPLVRRMVSAVVET